QRRPERPPPSIGCRRRRGGLSLRASSYCPRASWRAASSERVVAHNPLAASRSLVFCYTSRPMAIDAELLEILACPLCKEEVKPVALSERRRVAVRDKFRD